MALVLLGVGLVACNDDPEVSPIGVTEDVSGFGLMTSVTNLDIPTGEGTYIVTLNGGGSYGLWQDYNVAMEHKEWHFADKAQFDITDGVFLFTDTEGREIISGTYSGQGLMEGTQRQQIELVCSVKNCTDPGTQLVNNSFRLKLHDFEEDGACCFTMNGSCIQYGTE